MPASVRSFGGWGGGRKTTPKIAPRGRNVKVGQGSNRGGGDPSRAARRPPIERQPARQLRRGGSAPGRVLPLRGDGEPHAGGTLPAGGLGRRGVPVGGRPGLGSRPEVPARYAGHPEPSRSPGAGARPRDDRRGRHVRQCPDPPDRNPRVVRPAARGSALLPPPLPDHGERGGGHGLLRAATPVRPPL